jgi:plasmid stabilization system protein ParE
MAFRIEVEPQAFEDLDAIAEHIKNQSSFEAAERWFRGVMRSIQSLEQMPGRCPVAAESEDLNHEVRLLLHGRKNRAYQDLLRDTRRNANKWNRPRPSRSALGATGTVARRTAIVVGRHCRRAA